MLTFVVHCPYCHAVIASVDVDGDAWHEAELWAWLAAAEHRSTCPAGEARPWATADDSPSMVKELHSEATL